MKKLLLFLCFISSIFAYSQTSQNLRLEIEVEDIKKNEVIPIGKQGVLLLQKNDDSKNKQTSWAIIHYNSDLQESEKKNISLPKNFSLNRYFIDEDLNAIYLLFAFSVGQEQLSYINGEFIIYKISLDDLSMSRISGETSKAITIVRMVGMNDNIILGGHTVMSQKELMFRMCLSATCCYIPIFFGSLNKKSKVVYYTANFNSGRLQEQKLDQYEGSAAIGDIALNKEQQKVSILIQHLPKKDNYLMYVHEISLGGGKPKIINLKLKQDKGIKTAKLSYGDENELLVFGTYSNSAPSIFNASASNGVYSTKIVNGKQQFLKYYNFSDFTKFYELIGSLLNKRAVKKVAKKKAKLDKKGQELDVNYNLLVHNIISINDTYIMVAEAFYAEYHTETYTDCSSGKCVTKTRQVFDGYRYTHAIVAGFSKDGDLLWDNSFEIFNILTKQLKERVQVVAQPDNSIILAYNWGGVIYSKILRDNEIVNYKQSEPIETYYTDDKIKSNSNSDIDFWYDNFLLAHGVQLIKNKAESKAKNVKKNREILYLNKISYQ